MCGGDDIALPYCIVLLSYNGQYFKMMKIKLILKVTKKPKNAFLTISCTRKQSPASSIKNPGVL